MDVDRRNNRTRLFTLNPTGEAVRTRLNGLIADRRPIVLEPEHAAEVQPREIADLRREGGAGAQA